MGNYVNADRFFAGTYQYDWRCTAAFTPCCCNPVNSMDTINNITAFVNIMGLVV